MWKVQVDGRLSQERRLIRTLEDSLYDCLDDKKQKLYDKVRKQHTLSMELVIKDVLRCVT